MGGLYTSPLASQTNGHRLSRVTCKSLFFLVIFWFYVFYLVFLVFLEKKVRKFKERLGHSADLSGSETEQKAPLMPALGRDPVWQSSVAFAKNNVCVCVCVIGAEPGEQIRGTNTTAEQASKRHTPPLTGHAPVSRSSCVQGRNTSTVPSVPTH